MTDVEQWPQASSSARWSLTQIEEVLDDLPSLGGCV